MRVQHWITAILSVALLLSCGKSVFAQGGPGYYQQPGGWSTVPEPFPQPVSYGGYGGYGSGYGNWLSPGSPPALLPHHQSSFVPSYSPLNMGGGPGQAAYQPGMFPWPNVSQFHGPGYTKLHHTRGLWHFDTNSEGRRHFGSVEYMSSKVKKPDDVIGHKDARSYKQVVLGLIDQVLGEDELADAFQGDAPSAFYLGGVGTFPPGGGGQGQGQGQQQGIQGGPGFAYYDRVDARIMGHPKSNGLRVRWGFQDNDGTGIVIDGWWTGPGVVEFIGEDNATRPIINRAGLVRLIEEDLPVVFATGDSLPTSTASLIEPERVLRSLLNLRGIPVNNGFMQQLPDGSFIGGRTIPFDMRFDLKIKSQTAGTSLNVMMLPIVKKKNIRVTPLVGARYVYVNEQFNFFGEDSGLAYDNQDVGDLIYPQLKMHSLPDGIDNDQNGIIDDAAGFEDPDQQQQGGGGQGQQQQSEDGRWIRIDLLAEILGVEHPGHYEAFIENKSTSHLIGPEVGLQFEFGGDRVRLRGHTKFALLVNFEKSKLKGDNIGNANFIGTDIDISDPLNPTFDTLLDSPLITPTADNPDPNAFKDVETHAHVSPLFEQSIFLDLPVFDHVPYLKRMALFDEAKLTLGYTFIFIAELARPTESIIYEANPRLGLFPSLDINRGNWWTSNWSVGVEIPY